MSPRDRRRLSNRQRMARLARRSHLRLTAPMIEHPRSSSCTRAHRMTPALFARHMLHRSGYSGALGGQGLVCTRRTSKCYRRQRCSGVIECSSGIARLVEARRARQALASYLTRRVYLDDNRGRSALSRAPSARFETGRTRACVRGGGRRAPVVYFGSTVCISSPRLATCSAPLWDLP